MMAACGDECAHREVRSAGSHLRFCKKVVALTVFLWLNDRHYLPPQLLLPQLERRYDAIEERLRTSGHSQAAYCARSVGRYLTFLATQQ